MTRPVLVAGAGYVGAALCARLAAEGRSVYGLRRSDSALPRGVHPITANLATTDALSHHVGGGPVDVCYLLSPDGHDEAAYRRAYIRDLKRLASLVAIGRLVFASSTAVYGGSGWVDEDTPPRPESFSGHVLVEAEALAQELGETTVVRLGGIYGPGRDHTIRRIERGVAVAPLEGRRYGNRIHRDDAAGVFAHLLSAPPGCYAAVDDDPADMAVVERWLCAQLGVDPKRLTPAPTSRRGGDKRVRNARLRASGYVFTYPTFREGYASLIALR